MTVYVKKNEKATDLFGKFYIQICQVIKICKCCKMYEFIWVTDSKKSQTNYQPCKCNNHIVTNQR